MKKKVLSRHGKKIYLLGKDAEGINYWLEAPSWDCDWYWGFGYIETYTNNANPSIAKDITSHSHFDSMFLNRNKCAYDAFREFFKETPLTNAEIWELTDYMMTFYNLKSVAELFRTGYSHQTSRAKIDSLENQEQNDLVNKVWLPEVFKRIENILTK